MSSKLTCTLSLIRNVLLFHVYSGDMVFTAAALLVIAVAADLVLPRGDSGPIQRLWRILFLLSVPLGALGTVPIPLWLALPLIAAWVIHAALGFRQRTRRSTISGTILIILTCSSLVPETSWRLRHPPEHAPPPMIIVLGDSLSSGGFGESRTWIDIIDSSLEGNIVSLSLPSDTTASVLETRVTDLGEMCVSCGVFIELGGNEMLGNGSVRDYERTLERLVEESRSRGAEKVWIVELPPLPGRWWWPAAQRRVARETGSILIPRRVLASVLTGEENTYDGIHLTDRGHRELARRVRPWLGK